MQMVEVVRGHDEVDGPPPGVDIPGVEMSSSCVGAELLEVCGDELWSDDERRSNTFSSCYVKVNDPPLPSHAPTADR